MPEATFQNLNSLIDELRTMSSESEYVPHIYSLDELKVMDSESLRKIAHNAATELDIAGVNILPSPLTSATLLQIANRMFTNQDLHFILE